MNKSKLRIGACLAVLLGAVSLNAASPARTTAAESATEAKLITTVFFTPDSDELTHMAKGQLDAVHKAYPKSALQVVSIEGHADPYECTECGGRSDDYAIGLSQRRAGNVRSYLTGGNIPSGVMLTRAYGGARSKGMTQSQLRRVEVYFTAGTGW